MSTYRIIVEARLRNLLVRPFLSLEQPGVWGKVFRAICLLKCFSTDVVKIMFRLKLDKIGQLNGVLRTYLTSFIANCDGYRR